MYNEEDRKWLYGQFKDNGYETGTYEEFTKSLDNDDDFNWWHQEALGLGLEVGNIDDFSKMFRSSAVQQPTALESESTELMFWDEPQSPRRASESSRTEQKPTQPRPVVDYRGLNGAMYNPTEDKGADVNIPLSPETNPEIRAKEQVKREVSRYEDAPQATKDYIERASVPDSERYAMGRQDDNTQYLGLTDEQILEIAAEGKGYSVESAISAGKTYEGLKKVGDALTSEAESFKEKYAPLEELLSKAQDGTLKFKTQAEVDKFNKDYEAYKADYARLAQDEKDLKTTLDDVMASPAGREYKVLMERYNTLKEAEDTPENRLELTKTAAMLSRNPIARVEMGADAPGLSQIDFDLNRGEADYITAKLEEEGVDRAKKKELKARLKELNHEVLDNEYYQSDVARRIGEIDTELNKVMTRMNEIRTEAKKHKSAMAMPDDFEAELRSDPEYKMLLLSSNQLLQQKRKLEHIRDKNTSGFWVNFMDVFADPNTYNLSSTNLETAIAAKLAMDNPSMKGGEELISAVAGNNAVQSEEGQFVEGKGKWGAIAANSIPFMVTIAATNGFSGVADAVSGQVAKAAGKKLANKFLVKATGATLGDLAAGAVSANTIGVGKTATDFLNNYYGTLVQNPDGTYGYREGMGAGKALWKSEWGNIIEYSSERFGDHLQKLIGRGVLGAGIKAARTNGKGYVNPAVETLAKTLGTEMKDFGLRSATKIDANWGMKALSKFIDISNRAGVQGLPFECIEEYVGLLGNILVGGEEKWMDFSKFGDKETHADIWGGMLYSIGLTQASMLGVGGLGTAVAGVERMKIYKNLENSLAQQTDILKDLLGEEDAASVKAVVDGSTNKELPSKLVQFMNSGLWDNRQKEAILDYIKTTYLYRGFNAGTIAQARERLTSGDNLASLNIKAEVASAQEQLADAYMLGYNSTTDTRDEITQAGLPKKTEKSAIEAVERKEELDEAVRKQKERAKQATGIENLSFEEAEKILADENASQETKDAVLDYMMALSVERGFNDALKNKEIREKNAMRAGFEKLYGGQFYYTTPFGDNMVSTTMRINPSTGGPEAIFLLADEPNADGKVPYLSMQDGSKGFVSRDEVGDFEQTENGLEFKQGLVNEMTLDEYVNEAYIYGKAEQEREKAERDAQLQAEREASEAQQAEADAEKKRRSATENARRIVMKRLEENNGTIVVNGITGTLTHETEAGVTFIPDDENLSSEWYSWDALANVLQNVEPEVKKEPVVSEKEEGSGIPLDANGEPIYDSPSVTPEMAYDDIYSKTSEKNADAFIIEQSDAANKALSDALTLVANGEAEKVDIDNWDKKQGEGLNAFARRQAEAKAKVDERIKGAQSSLPELQRKVEFWDELREVAEEHIKERDEEAKRQKTIEQYGVDIRKLDTAPASMEEYVADELSGFLSGDGRLTWDSVLSRIGTNMRSDLRKNGWGFKLRKNADDTSVMSLDFFVHNVLNDGQFVTDETESEASDMVCELMLRYTPAELSNFILDARIEQQKEAAERAEAVPASDAVEAAPEGTEVPAEAPEVAEGTQESEGEAETVKGSTYKLSDEVDENGRQFVLNSDGELAFGEIPAESGLPAAPILLSEGMITNPATNDGYGLVHIEARHGEQIRQAGYSSVLEFIEEVAKNYEIIRKGKERDGVQTYMLQLTDKNNNTLIVELSGDGTYWNINTAGVFRTSYGAKNNIVYNRSASAKQSAETVEETQPGEQNGGTQTGSSGMTTPTQEGSSEDKGSNNSGETNPETEKTSSQETTTKNQVSIVQQLPSNLRVAYESGNAEQISEAEKALSDYINSSDSVMLLKGTENSAKTRRKAAEKGSAEYKLQDFILKTIKTRLDELDKTLPKVNGLSVVKAYDEARKVYEERFNAEKEDLESAISYYEGERDAAQNLLDKTPKDADELFVTSLKNRLNAANNHLEGLYQELKRFADEETSEEKQKSPTSESKEAKDTSSDERIEDFGEKIGGARKDTYRAKIQDSVKLTPKDLKALKDPDKILPRKKIISLMADGSMTKEDGLTLLAMNMAVRALSDSLGMKTLGLMKYRDLASAWEQGNALDASISDADIDFMIEQKSERVKALPDIRERERKSLEVLFERVYNDYKATYEALDYPAVTRALKSAYIRLGHADNRYWVVSGPNVGRGWPFSTMEQAVAKMKSAYPEIKISDTKSDKSNNGDEDKIGSLAVVKDEGGWYRIKSRSIPGKIYLSKKFYNREDAEQFLKDNAAALVDREQKMVDALLGSNIGMVQREGMDYRNGRDVTPDQMLETFGFRGVEFGNWVPQTERQEYLNKTYDAIMDFCEIVGISPKAFSLGGRLGLAFGARGHSRALAHYEPMKEVINLTRMKGAGSLAHEWFHALDNYLAKQKTGNTSDMATATKDVVREELSNVFKEFVNEMSMLAYSRRSQRAGDYWGEVWERAARLFESYVYNELASKSVVSPLLVRKDTLFDDIAEEDQEASSWPYPSIAENEHMKPYFDRLFETIEEKTDPEGRVALYRRGATDKANSLVGAEAVIDKLADELGVKYDIDNTIRGKGQFVPSNGKILINFDAHSDIADLEATLLHEAVAHYGLRKLFGAQFHELILSLYDNAADEIKASVDAISLKHNLSKEVAMEEYLANLAEKEDYDKKEESFWQQVLNAFKALFAKLGFGERLTDEDLRAMLYASYRNLQKRGAVETATRIVTYQTLRKRADISRQNSVDESSQPSPTGEQPLNRLRDKEAPSKTKKVYKLMRLGLDGKLYPLFIDSVTPIELGKWYDADSPDMEFLKKMPSGVFLVNPSDGTYTSLEDYQKKHGQKSTKFPSIEAINEASERGMRWVKITDTERGQRRYEGENRKYENIGINGSGAVSTFAMRPGWHAGSLPTMRQIGKGPQKNLRDDSFVWVEGEVSADVDYNEEAQGNPDNDIPTHIPTDGFYMKATNANKAASQADRVGWYVAGAFRPIRIISDAEARSVIDEFNAAHPEQSPVEYDWPRESGKDFFPESETDEYSINNANFVDNGDEILRRAGMDTSDGNQDRTGASDQGGLREESGENGLDGGPRGNDRGAVVPGLFGEDQGGAGTVGEYVVAAEQRQGDKRYPNGREGQHDVEPHPMESAGRADRSDSRSDEGRELAQSGGTDRGERSGVSDGLSGAVQSGDVHRRILSRSAGRGLRGLLSYIRHSKGKSLESVAPTAIAESMDKTLSEIEKQYGDIDEFVKNELGYETKEALYNALSGEQIDGVAMAIHQMKKGQAMIIGDQTGVGKGRQMAALIRWANRQGKKPIFFTSKDTLFSDLYRDMKDTGSSELRPLIINADRAMVDNEGKEIYVSPTNAELNAIMALGTIPEEYDYVVLTYSQLSSGDSQSRSEKGAKTEGQSRAMSKAEFIRKIAADNYLLCDESHTAAGQGQTGAFMRSIIPSSAGVTFASATFAKRPDSMPIYALKSAMSEAKIGALELIDIVRRGGVILQEIMSRELAKAGQMVRRQRLMDDVETEWKTVTNPELAKKAKDGYDAVIKAYKDIIAFQRKHGGRVYLPNSYNFTRQLMLALKVDAIVEEALSELKAGRKPLIALENTRESAISNYSIGDELSDSTFAPTLISMLSDIDGLDEEGQREYGELLKKIQAATKDIPVSPIDAIVEKLEALGYKVGEITRRTKKVRTEAGKSIIVKHNSDNTPIASAFNNGDTDVLILNRSGATGISLHASEKFKDQRPRTMIIAQPLGDINEYQQMLGRIDRTGQVHRGKYINLSLPIPAEQRFNMMLANKLKSLSANTTTESEASNIEAPDLLNKYGAKVMYEFLQDNPELFEALGIQLGYKAHPVRTVEDLDKYTPVADDAEKITGALALLPVEQQEAFYEGVTSRYQELIKSLDETGQNDLRITTLPLRAKTISKEVVTKGRDSSSSNPFAQDSFVEKVEADVLTKPMTVAEIAKSREKLGGTDAIKSLRDRVSIQKEARLDAEEKRFIEAKEGAKEEDITTIEKRHRANVERIKSIHDSIINTLERFSLDKTYLIHEEFGMDAEDNAGRSQSIGSVPGVLLGFKAPKDGSSVTPSTITAVFATLDGRRKVEVKLSDSFILDDIISQTEIHSEEALKTTLDNWDSSIPKETREERYIITGNVLQAWADLANGGILPGRLVSYTDENGNVTDGILMNKSWKPENEVELVGTPISEHLQDILDGKIVRSADGKLQIQKGKDGYLKGKFFIIVPKAVKDGGAIAKDKTVLGMVGGYGFSTHNYNFKLAIINPKKLASLLQYLSDKYDVRVNEETVYDETDSGRPGSSASVSTKRLGYSGIEDRKSNESPIVFFTRVVESLISKYKGITSEQVVVSSYLLGLTPNEQAERKNGSFTPGSKDITIFVKDDKTIADEIEKTFFHEALHMALDTLGWKNDSVFVKAFNEALVASGFYSSQDVYDNTLSRLNNAYKKESGRSLTEGELMEEMLTYSLSSMMQDGRAYVLVEGARASGYTTMAEELNLLLNTIGYESEKEFRSRADESVQAALSGQPWRQNDIQRGDVSDSDAGTLSENGRASEERSTEKASAVSIKSKVEYLSTPLSRARAISEASRLAESLGAKLKEDASLNGKVRFEPSSNTVFVNINKHNDLEDLKNSVFNETLAYLGMSAVYGEEWSDIRKKLYDSTTNDVRSRIDSIAEADKLATSVAFEKYLVQLLEDGVFTEDEETFLSDVKETMLELFSKYGVSKALPEYILYQSYNNAQRMGAVERARVILTAQKIKEAANKDSDEDGGPDDDGPDSPMPLGTDDTEPADNGAELYELPEELLKDTSDLLTEHEVDDVVRETEEGIVAETAADVYERRTASPWQNMRAQLVEEYQPLLNLIRAILNWNGDVRGKDVSSLKDDERVIERLHEKASREWYENEKYWDEFFRPMMNALGRFIKKANRALGPSGKSRLVPKGQRITMNDMIRYACLKSSLDRNEAFAKRDAKIAARKSYEKAYALRIEELDKREREEKARLQFKLDSGLISDVTYYDEITRLELEINSLRAKAKTELDSNLENVENETAREYKRLLGLFRMNDYAALLTWFEKPSEIRRKDYPSRPAYNKAQEAEKSKYIDGVTDLTSAEAMAKAFVSRMEGRAGADATAELWDCINAATKETLKFQQEHGILSRQQAREISSMMKYYLPMRGFTEDTAETSYMYYLTPRGDGFAPTVLAARGRHGKKYRNPFGMIGFMHSSAVSQGLRNEAKLALLTLVRNHPTDLVTVTRTWFKKTDEVDSEGKPIFVPVYPEMPEGTATKDREDITKKFEEEMLALKASGDAYNAISGVVKAGGVVAFEQKKHKEEHVVRVQEGGIEYGIIINGNPAAAQSINGLAKRGEDTERALEAIDFFRNIQSRFATTYNPRFWILNFFRDSIQGLNNAFIRDGMGYLGRYGLNWLRIVPQIAFHVAGAGELLEKIDPKIAGYYKEFVENGGPMRQSRIMNDEDHSRRIERYIRYKQYDKANALNAAYFVGHLLSSIGEATETLTRFVTYATSRAAGKPIHQSIADAKEITVNFSRHGRRSYSLDDIFTWEYENGRKLFVETEGGKKIPTPDALGFLLVSKFAGYFRHAKMFYNPSMQGIDNLRSNFSKHPYRASLVAATYAAIGFAMMFLSGGGDDDKDKSSYSHTSDYYRGNSFLISIGNGKYLRIALPQEYRMFYKLGDILASVFLQSRPYEKLLHDSYEAIADLGPSGVLSDAAGVAHSALPSLAVPFYEVHENKNYLGGRIYDNGFNDSKKYDPKWTKALPTTGEGYVKVAEELNRRTGGKDNNDVISGVIDLNPAAIEHYIDGFFSGPANIASLATQNIRSGKRREPVKTKDKIVMGRLLYDTNDYDRDAYYTDMYYYFMDIAEEAESIHSKFKDRTGRGDKQVEEFYRSKPYKYMLEYKNAEAEEREMKKEMRDAAKNGNTARVEELKSRIQRKHEEVGRRCLEIYFKEENEAK